MRHFSPAPIPKHIEKWLYDALTRLQSTTEQMAAGVAAVSRGETPDGSGNPLIPDLTNYFYLPGRHVDGGGQIAYFDTNDSGFGVLSSTKSATKGNIYLGSARGSAFDELNNRLGMGTTAPQARVHAVGVAGGVAYSASTLSNTAWGLYSGAGGGGTPPATVHAAITSPSDDDGGVGGGYIGRNGDNNGISANTHVTLNTSPGSGTSFLVNLRLRRLGAAIPSGTGFGIGVVNSAGVEYLGSFDPSVLTTTWTTYQITCSTAGTTGLTPNSLRISATFQSGTGASGYLLLTYVEVLIGTGTSTGSIIAQLASGQSAHLYDAQNTSGTSLVDVTAGGRLTVESGGSFRHVPGAGASTLFKGDVNGDATWGTVTLLSAFISDTVAGTVVLGDMIVGNATPKWDKLAGNTTTTRKFLRQVGNGTISALPAWDTLVSGDLPSTVLGWTDSGTIVSLTTITDQVGIGTATPGANLGVTNANAASAINVLLKGAASQTGDMLRITDSANVTRFAFQTPTTETALKLTMPSGGKTKLMLIPGAAGEQAYIDFGNTFDFGPPLGTSNGLPPVGTRFNTFWDPSNPQLCDAYGQDSASCWVLIDIASDYILTTGDTTSASRDRARWNPNGDLTNFGKIRSRKFTVGTTGLTAGVPGIELEETGAGTGVILVRAPAVVTPVSEIQLLQDMIGTFVMVGDDPPAVASRALGKVDLTGQTAAIASTALSNGAPAGLYAIEVYAVCTTASGSGAPTLDVTLGWTDVLGATTANAAGLNGTTFPLSLAATGRAQAKFILQLASGNITYSTTINAASGSPQYAIYIRVISLG